MLCGIQRILFQEYQLKDVLTYTDKHYDRWMWFNLLFLATSSIIGALSSGFFFSDDKAVHIPGQSPAQSFVMVASGTSTLCVVLHFLAAREQDRKMYLIYSVRKVFDVSTCKELQQRFPHFSHAWVVILQFYALFAWVVALILTACVWGIWVQNTNHSLARYVLANMVASCMGVSFTTAYLASILRAKRPYRLRSWKKEVEDLPMIEPPTDKKSEKEGGDDFDSDLNPAGGKGMEKNGQPTPIFKTKGDIKLSDEKRVPQ
ncbi:hypothetical protein B0T16DRAFT_407333 [Cercophora newfieldiana]|uniref:Transmembrane protein n=1 Tax=Cercophora newfieldiana TaxID=92897 RepID=A0AA40CXN7_9PEZI|nr:hypothetical protein B0T16DRAFT_407333 [Cercophora newfieldiana]